LYLEESGRLIENMKKRGRVAKVYTREKALIVRARARAREKVVEVCAELGMDHSRFCRWCRKNNFKVHTARTLKQALSRPRGDYSIGKPPEASLVPRKGSRSAAILADLKKGMSPKATAERNGVTHGYVCRLRAKTNLNPPAGLGRNFRGPNPSGNRRKSPRTLAILEGLQAGQSAAEIARRHGVSPQWVHILKARMLQPG
jgi:transposase-like protein